MLKLDYTAEAIVLSFFVNDFTRTTLVLSVTFLISYLEKASIFIVLETLVIFNNTRFVIKFIEQQYFKINSMQKCLMLKSDRNLAFVISLDIHLMMGEKS